MKNFIKEYIFSMLQPTAFISILLIISFILIVKGKAIGKKSLGAALVLLCIASSDPVTEYLLHSIEGQYQAYSINQNDNGRPIVVLAGGYTPGSDLPASSELPSASMIRLVEGIRIHRQLNNSKLVLTGKGWADKAESEAMSDMATSLGVRRDKIIIEKNSMNTFEHTQYLNSLLKNKDILLVTSALHMPRAMGLFKKAGFNPTAVPTNHILVGNYSFFRVVTFLPNAENLLAMDRIFYELFGTWWAKLSGKI